MDYSPKSYISHVVEYEHCISWTTYFRITYHSNSNCKVLNCFLVLLSQDEMCLLSLRATNIDLRLFISMTYGLGFSFHLGFKSVLPSSSCIPRSQSNSTGNENHCIFYRAVIWPEQAWEKEILKIRDVPFPLTGHDIVIEEDCSFTLGVFSIKVSCQT